MRDVSRPFVFALVLATSLSVASACAFPPQGCRAEVCANLNIHNYAALLDPKVFDVNDTSQRGDWSKLGMLDLGYYFGVYNPLYNRGQFNPRLKAKDDNAPFLNYFGVQSSFGRYNRSATTLRKCCDACRSVPDCQLFTFNPNVINDVSEDGRLVRRRFDGFGKCYLQIKDTFSLSAVHSKCVNSSAMFLRTTKPTFYGGDCFDPRASQVVSDPHFVGARGTRFDFNGEIGKTYCLVADRGLAINALFRGYQAPRSPDGKSIRSWLGEVGLLWTDALGVPHSLHLAARRGSAKTAPGLLSSIAFDGAGVGLPLGPGRVVEAAGMVLEFQGVRREEHGRDAELWRVLIGDETVIEVSVRSAMPSYQLPTDAFVHFDLRFNRLSTTEAVHGILGQTFRKSPGQVAKAVKYSALSKLLRQPVVADGVSGLGFLEGAPKDYEVSNIMSADCRVAPAFA